MKNVIITIIFAVGLAFAVGFLSYRWGRADERATTAQTQTQVIVNHTVKTQTAIRVVDSADDCGIKRVLCKTARGGCDANRVCDTPDPGRNNAENAIDDGITATDSQE